MCYRTLSPTSSKTVCIICLISYIYSVFYVVFHIFNSRFLCVEMNLYVFTCLFMRVSDMHFNKRQLTYLFTYFSHMTFL